MAAAVLANSVRKKTILISKRSCGNGLLFSLDMVFLQERQRGPRPAMVVRMARALWTSRPGACQGGGAPGHRKESKNHCWVGRAQTCFVPGLQRGEEKHCWVLDGGGAGPNMFCARTPKLAERGVKNTAGGSVRAPNIFCPRIPKPSERGVKNTAWGEGGGL